MPFYAICECAERGCIPKKTILLYVQQEEADNSLCRSHPLLLQLMMAIVGFGKSNRGKSMYDSLSVGCLKQEVRGPVVAGKKKFG